MSKGDKPRPLSVDQDTYARNFERTFNNKPLWVRQIEEKIIDASQRNETERGNNEETGF